ncbi:hypothetical protein NG819_08075 [Pseudarthrobacter sp. Fe7]|nr:hypothetical protein NG819_08075 [Pseudarthrobacter sp. Fe7]
MTGREGQAPETGAHEGRTRREPGNALVLWLRSLAGRITLVTAGVAILAVLVTGSVAFPLIRSAAVTQAREQLSRQADAFSAAPVAAQALDLRERHLLGPDNYDLSTITPAGTVTGAAAAILGPDEVHQVFSGQKISRTLTRGGVQFLVEARPLTRGGGIVLTRSLADVNAASAQAPSTDAPGAGGRAPDRRGGRHAACPAALGAARQDSSRSTADG